MTVIRSSYFREKPKKESVQNTIFILATKQRCTEAGGTAKGRAGGHFFRKRHKNKRTVFHVF
jgi:hypothetical protein